MVSLVTGGGVVLLGAATFFSQETKEVPMRKTSKYVSLSMVGKVGMLERPETENKDKIFFDIRMK